MWYSQWGWGRAHGPGRWAWGWWTPGYQRSSPCNRCGQCPSRRWSLEQGSDWPTCPALPEYWPMLKGWHILYITFVLPFFPYQTKKSCLLLDTNSLRHVIFKAIKKYSTVLADLNEFSSIFCKRQHSHSRHQKTISNLHRIISQGRLRVSNKKSLEGALYMYINLPPPSPFFSSNFSEYWWFQTKQFTRLLEFIKLYKTKPTGNFFHFHYLPKL